MTGKNITLERIMDGPTERDYPDCVRCGTTVERDQFDGNLCTDCKYADQVYAPGQNHRGAKQMSTPAFEITIHDLQDRLYKSPVKRPINEAGFTYLESAVDQDPGAHHFVTDVLGHYVWPVITVTSYGRLLAHWEGLQTGLLPDRYSQLRGLYEQVLSNKTKPLSF